MNVGHICCYAVTARPDESAKAAAGRLLEHNCSTLVTIDARGRPTGIVTERALTMWFLALGRSAGETCLGEIMAARPPLIREEGTIELALTLMRENRQRYLAVVDADEKLVGVLGIDDVLRHLAREFRVADPMLARGQLDVAARR